jgi:beta-xylosidase
VESGAEKQYKSWSNVDIRVFSLNLREMKLTAFSSLIFLNLLLLVEAFKNPIISGFNPDPTILRDDDGMYYLVTSTFRYFPGLPIYQSSDLVNWELIGHGLSRPSQLPIYNIKGNAGVWAPTLRKHDNRYYLTCSTWYRYDPPLERHWPRPYYVWSDNINDPDSWSDPIYFDQKGYDSDIFWDDDGSVYLTTTYYWDDNNVMGVFISEVDLETGRSLEKPKQLYQAKVDGENFLTEASHLYKFNGTYYLMTAVGGTGRKHREWIVRGQSPYGPWEENPLNPILQNSDENPEDLVEIEGTGHADLTVDDNGHWWGVFLGVRRPENGKNPGFLSRETFLSPVNWEDGWPLFNNHQEIGLEMPGLYDIEPPTEWRDDFEDGNPELSLGWYTVGTPLKSLYSKTERPGYLRVYGGYNNLTIPETSAVYLQKQKHYNIEWSTSLEFDPEDHKEEAGAIIYANDTAHHEVGVRLCSGENAQKCAFTRVVNQEGDIEEKEIPLDYPEKATQLHIMTNYTTCSLGYSQDNQPPKYSTTFSTSLLTTAENGTGTFTGSMLGVYATGNGETVVRPADFSYAKWTRLD